MEDEIISFETAQAAKKAAFPQTFSRHQGFHYNLSGERFGWGLWDQTENNFSAPTQAVLQRWLREKHHLSVEPRYGVGSQDWSYVLTNLQTRTSKYTMGFSSYEEALEKGLHTTLTTL